MTFSIVGRSADGKQHGVAVASYFLAVGAAVPAAEAGVGALATQAFANIADQPRGLALLAQGSRPADVVSSLATADEGREHRQLGVVGATGDGATYTGAQCHTWAGGRAGEGYAIQGNILVGEQVVAGMEQAWLASPADAPLARRLLAALRAGDEAGGDRRGRQSAALLVVAAGGGYGGGSDVLVDLRVDDGPTPVPELGRLLDLHDFYFGHSDPADLLPLDDRLRAEVADLLTGAGYDPAGRDVEAALEDWAGVVNLEMRLVAPDRIDPVLLGALRKTAG